MPRRGERCRRTRTHTRMRARIHAHARAVQAWLHGVEERRRTRQVGELVMARWINHRMAKAFAAWSARIVERVRFLSLLGRGVARWQHTRLWRAVHTWQKYSRALGAIEALTAIRTAYADHHAPIVYQKVVAERESLRCELQDLEASYTCLCLSTCPYPCRYTCLHMC